MPKFRVTGSNRETSARMTLELTAASKGDAERKASQAGMVVSHVTPIDDSNTTLEENKHTMAKNYRQEESGSNQKKLIIIFLILLVIFLFTGLVWPGFWR